jgi:hypothetical protein
MVVKSTFERKALPQSNRPPRLVGALKALDKAAKALEDEGKPASAPAAARRAALLERLGWGHWAARERARAEARFPSSYPPI